MVVQSAYFKVMSTAQHNTHANIQLWAMNAVPLATAHNQLLPYNQNQQQ
jgi:hypothetical protein